MTEADNRRITRKEFVGLGLSAALLSTGVSPWVAKAQTVKFGAATTGKLSDYCRGNGLDETAAIQQCFRTHRFVEVDEPPAGKGYGIALKEDGGVRIRSGQEVNGVGGWFVRAGAWRTEHVMLKNGDFVHGNSDIKLNNVIIDGRRTTDPTVPDRAKDNNTTGIVFKTFDPAGEKLRNITLTGVQVRNWPGIGIRFFHAKHVDCIGVKVLNPARGGIRFTGACYDVNLLRCLAQDVGESAFGLWASNVVLSEPNESFVAGDLHDIYLKDCRGNTRANSEFGSALMLWGARNVTALGCTFGPAKNDVVHLNSDTATRTEYSPRDIRIENCKMLGGKANSFKILADYAARILIRKNYMSKPAKYCVSVSPWGERKIRAFQDVRITGNTFVKPRQGYVQIDKRIKGVRVRGNRQR